MHWVVQSNIFHEENYEHLLSTLDRLSLSYSTHKVVPFVGTIDPEPTLPDGTDVIVMGSYALARYAQRRGWRPGAFVDNLEFELQREHWGERMLNADATVVPFAAIPFQREPFVLRPVLDTKSFTGMVIDWGEYESWRDRILALETAGEDSAGLGLGSRDAATMAKMPGFDDKLGARMRDVGVTRCTADKWPAEAITCMTNAQTEGDAQSCYGKLTADQSAKMNTAAMTLMAPPAGAAGRSAAAPK